VTINVALNFLQLIVVLA